MFFNGHIIKTSKISFNTTRIQSEPAGETDVGKRDKRTKNASGKARIFLSFTPEYQKL